MGLNLEALREEQKRLADRLILRDDFDPASVRVVAGGDLTFLNTRATPTRGLACFALLSYPDLEPVDQVIVEDEVDFPYIPGYLAYREAPLLMEAYLRVKGRADLYILDGHGIAHPRGLGIASYFGVMTGEVVIGCAKSRLWGKYAELPESAGAKASLTDPGGRLIGMALRPPRGKNPLFVSPGHRISLETSVHMVQTCLDGYRVPAPTRHAHNILAAARRKACQS